MSAPLTLFLAFLDLLALWNLSSARLDLPVPVIPSCSVRLPLQSLCGEHFWQKALSNLFSKWRGQDQAFAKPLGTLLLLNPSWRICFSISQKENKEKVVPEGAPSLQSSLTSSLLKRYFHFKLLSLAFEIAISCFS